MKIILVLIVGIITLGAFGDPCLAGQSDNEPTFIEIMTSLGYTCTTEIVDGFDKRMIVTTCTKTIIGYTATQTDTYTLEGTRVSTVDTKVSSVLNSPFIYFLNSPQGNISISINSKLNSYLPLPLFNRADGWNVIGNKETGAITLDGVEQKNLFYELAINNIILNRYGRNFISKDAIISYLNNSNFFTKLGFSEEEKKNSLGYFIPKILEASDTKYYYLTVLEPESIADISTLNVIPEPNRIDRRYFAVYPTNVPVRTEGDFVFPKTEPENGFTVKETGEFLINSGMFVFFK